MAQEHTHEFDCKLCGTHLDSRQQLDQHTRANHADSIQASQSSRGTEAPRQAPPSNPSSERS